MSPYVLDTSVLIELIVRRSPFKEKVRSLLTRGHPSQETLILTTTLAETYYIATRIYQTAGVGDAEKQAQILIEWLTAHSRVIPVDYEIALEAGRLKNRLGLYLADNLVIAAAKVLGARALFKKPEKEMAGVLGELRRMKVEFLASGPGG